MEIRLLKALTLLRDVDVKIIHVAEQCGFNHLGLFNACFKKRFGNTPGQWRKGTSNGEVMPSPVSEVGHPACPIHANGLCPWAPKQDDSAAAARNITSMQESIRSNGPAHPKIREGIMRNMRKVSAQMASKSNFGVALQNRS